MPLRTNMTGRARSTGAIVVHIAFLLALLAASSAEAADELYRSRFVVTGQSEENRIPGFAACLEDVLVKASGDPRLIGDPDVAALKRQAASFVTGFTYRDLYAGKALHDEQGSYDRPHYLTVDFDPAKINEALMRLGRKPWTAPRPTLAVFLSVEKYGQRYVVTSDDPRDTAMGEAFAAASVRFALPMRFPTRELLDTADLTFETLPADHQTGLARLAAASGGGLPLAGTLVWSDKEHGWIADWWLAPEDRLHHWQVRGVNFDTAFRDAILGAARILSGNGEPD